MKKQQIKPKREPLSRTWFFGHGYHKHPRLNLWGHEGCAYFVGACGQKLLHTYGPAMRAKQKGRGYTAPNMRHFDNKACHIIMGEIFYGERPVFINSKGNPYFGVCHHLIEDPLNYCPENLLCWLTYSEHRIADNRRRALEEVVPDGNLVGFDYAILRELQDPRTMSDIGFETHMQYLRVLRDCGFDPRIFTASQLREFFVQPFDEFKTAMYHHKNDE